jgi:hypothetical protein
MSFEQPSPKTQALLALAGSTSSPMPVHGKAEVRLTGGTHRASG